MGEEYRLVGLVSTVRSVGSCPAAREVDSFDRLSAIFHTPLPTPTNDKVPH